VTVPPAQRVSAATLQRVRDYVVEEPSFTIAFAAWELGLSSAAVGSCVTSLLEGGVIQQIEERNGPYAAVYTYTPPGPQPPKRRHFPELDDSRAAGVGAEAEQRGVIVPHTRSEGPSGKPGRDKRRQANGVRVKRRRQGT